MNQYHHATILQVDRIDDFDPSSYVVSAERQVVKVARFGIDNARELVRQTYQRPANADQQLLIVITDFITHEAQNALLKALEEPPHSTLFLFVVPNDFVVLPTLASRFYFAAQVHERATQNTNESFKVFLDQTPSERIAMVEAMIKKDDRVWQRSIKRGLIDYLVARQAIDFVAPLEYGARTLLTRGASNKMLLEHIALILPVS